MAAFHYCMIHTFLWRYKALYLTRGIKKFTLPFLVNFGIYDMAFFQLILVLLVIAISFPPDHNPIIPWTLFLEVIMASKHFAIFLEFRMISQKCCFSCLDGVLDGFIVIKQVIKCFFIQSWAVFLVKYLCGSIYHLKFQSSFGSSYFWWFTCLFRLDLVSKSIVSM